MTRIAQRTKQVLLRKYPDGWLHAGFAFLLGTFLGVIALVNTRAEGLGSDDFVFRLLPAWMLALGFYVGAFALLTARRWGLLLLCAAYSAVAVFFLRTYLIIPAALFGYPAWSYYKSYRESS
ncbi:MAG: hypothetical protein KBC96_14540 [Armatimonadetes bacterium]|nr:hypothetical protein [Armatimonadota bacterium]